MIGSVLNYVGLRLLGETSSPNDNGDGALAKGRKWILDHGGATSIPSWGKVYLSVCIFSSFFYLIKYVLDNIWYC